MISSKKNVDIDNYVDKYSVRQLCFFVRTHHCLFTKTVKRTRNNILEKHDYIVVCILATYVVYIIVFTEST